MKREYQRIIEDAMRDKGISRADLAEHLGITVGAVGLWLRPKTPTPPGDDKLLAIAEFLDIPYGSLVRAKRSERKRLVLLDAALEPEPEFSPEALEMARYYDREDLNGILRGAAELAAKKSRRNPPSGQDGGGKKRRETAAVGVAG